MEGMKDIKSDGSVGNETEKGGSIHRPSFDDNYGHFTAIVQWESIVLALQTVEDMFRSYMEALIDGNDILFRCNCGVVATKQYSRIIFILAEKRITDTADMPTLSRWKSGELMCRFLKFWPHGGHRGRNFESLSL